MDGVCCDILRISSFFSHVWFMFWWVLLPIASPLSHWYSVRISLLHFGVFSRSNACGIHIFMSICCRLQRLHLPFFYVCSRRHTIGPLLKICTIFFERYYTSVSFFLPHSLYSLPLFSNFRITQDVSLKLNLRGSWFLSVPLKFSR